MKLPQSWKHVILLTTLVFAQAVSAETPAEETEKKCIKPKFRDFSPAHKAEVAPETQISFHINRFADPLHIGASAKKISMPVEIVDKQTFYYVTAKLPKELRDGYARIHVEAKSTEGDCVGTDGWLIQINEKAKAVSSNEQSEDKSSVATSAE